MKERKTMSNSSRLTRRSCVKELSTGLRYESMDDSFYNGNFQKTKWSKEEDVKLQRLVEEYGSDNWHWISYNFKCQRSDTQCQWRWQNVLNPELVKGPWTKDEDERVIQLVHKYGPKKWSIIAKHLNSRIGKQCRERWHNHLSPAVKKSLWTLEDDRVLYQAQKHMGNCWAQISKLLPGRTDNSIKNHWNSTLKRKLKNEGYLLDLHRSSITSSDNSSIASSDASTHSISRYWTSRRRAGDRCCSCCRTSTKQGEGLCSHCSSNVKDEVMPSCTQCSLEDQCMDRDHLPQCTAPYTASPPLSPTKHPPVYSPSMHPLPRLLESVQFFQDPVAWGEWASYSLQEMTSLVEEQSSPSPWSTKELRRGNVDQISPRLHRNINTVPVMDGEMQLKEGEKPNSTSSNGSTPVRALEFSPSEFFNKCPSKDSTLTSTPVCANKQSSVTESPQHRGLAIHYGNKHNSKYYFTTDSLEPRFRTPMDIKALMLPTHQMPTPSPFKCIHSSQEGPHMREGPQMQGGLQTQEGLHMQIPVCWKSETKSLFLEAWSEDSPAAPLCPQEHFHITQIQGESLLSGLHLNSSLLGCEELGCSPDEKPELPLLYYGDLGADHVYTLFTANN